jgi:uncharacterized membrane protein YsdA (DUF1294 family)
MTTITMLLVLVALAAIVVYTSDRIRQENRRRDRETVLRIIRYLDATAGRRVT